MAFGAYAPLPIRLGGLPEEGWSAAQYLRATADLCAAMRVAPFAWLTINQNGNAPFVVDYSGRNGIGTRDRPTVEWVNSIGRTRITWPADWRDEYGKAHRVRVKGARGSIKAGGGFLLIDDITVYNQLDVVPVSRAGAIWTDKVFFLKVY